MTLTLMESQRDIHNPVEHLRWSFLRKESTIFAKSSTIKGTASFFPGTIDILLGKDILQENSRMNLGKCLVKGCLKQKKSLHNLLK